MNRFFRVFFAAWGGCLIGFWHRSLDTDIGRLWFTLGVILVAGAWISDIRSRKNKQE
ncbi:MAG: hypothetical protein IKB62_08005 [Oscillospiraceae bacterium]|nr:hypothetical protein [Oscillospiraceae bacterium]